jgi:hypothetical protein
MNSERRSRTHARPAMRFALAAVALSLVVPGWMLLTREWALFDASGVSTTGGAVLPFMQLWGELAGRVWKALAVGLAAGVAATFLLRTAQSASFVVYVVGAAGFFQVLDPLLGLLLIVSALCGAAAALLCRPGEAPSDAPSLPDTPGAAFCAALEAAAAADRAKLPGALQEVLQRVEARLREQLAAQENEPLGIASHDVQSVARSLPEVIANYVRLDETYRELEPLADGRTPAQHTLEQLLVLERVLDGAHRARQSVAAQAILVQNRFLQTRFATDHTA